LTDPSNSNRSQTTKRTLAHDQFCLNAPAPTTKLGTHDLISFWGRKILPKLQPFPGFDSERESGQWWDEDRRGTEEKAREMARGEWRLQLHHRGNWNCSCTKITLLVCFFNIVVALYTLRSLYASLYIYSDRVARNSKSCQSFQDVFLSVSPNNTRNGGKKFILYGKF